MELLFGNSLVVIHIIFTRSGVFFPGNAIPAFADSGLKSTVLVVFPLHFNGVFVVILPNSREVFINDLKSLLVEGERLAISRVFFVILSLDTVGLRSGGDLFFVYGISLDRVKYSCALNTFLRDTLLHHILRKVLTWTGFRAHFFLDSCLLKSLLLTTELLRVVMNEVVIAKRIHIFLLNVLSRSRLFSFLTRSVALLKVCTDTPFVLFP